MEDAYAYSQSLGDSVEATPAIATMALVSLGGSMVNEDIYRAHQATKWVRGRIVIARLE
jgi:hypothetical protein